MLPVVALGRHCCSLATDLENYRQLVGDELTDEANSIKWPTKNIVWKVLTGDKL